jgi:hypothetical protein
MTALLSAEVGLFLCGLAALFAWTLTSGLVVPAAGFFPALWLSADSFLAATRIPIELLCAAGLLATLAGVWWHLYGATWAERRPGLLRRRLLPAAFVVLAVVGGIATARLAQRPDADQYAVTAAGGNADAATAVKQAVPVAEGTGWSKMSSQRLQAGLPVVIIAFLVLGGMAAVAAKLAHRCP